MAKWSDATQQRKTEEFQLVAAKFAGMGLEQLETSYAEARKSKAELELQEKPINTVIMVLELLFAEKFAEEGLKTVKFDDGGRITVGFETPLTIEDKAAFIKWLKETGREFELTVYAATATRIAKEVMDETQKLPEGMKAGDPIPKVTYTPAK